MPGPIYLGNAHDDTNGKFPWWVRAISFVGVPSAALAFVLWFLVTDLSARLINIQENIRLHSIDATYTLKATEHQNLQLQAMFRLLQQICVNTARTSDDRGTCWNPWR